MEHVDILIQNGQVLTINDSMEIIENGVIAIKGNIIQDIGNAELVFKYKAKKVLDAKGGIVMPGMVNTHNHVPMIAFRGLGEEGIADRLMGYFMPLEKELLSRELIYLSTIHGAIDMALSGVTTFADMYYHVDEMAKAVTEVGIRAIVGQTIIGFQVVDAKMPYDGLEYAKSILPCFQNNELVSLALAPHAPYSVSKEKLLEIKELSDDMNLMIHMHAAEFQGEQNKISDNTEQTSVVKYLDSIGFLDDKVLLAHCNYLDAEDLEIMRKRGVRIAHNPMANAKGATGVAPIPEALDLHIPIGLGTDGPMGSNVVDLFKVMTYTSTVQRLRKMDESIMTPETVVRMATLGGAEALGMNQNLGSLEKGKMADIVIIETQSPNMIPNHNPYATLVFQANPHNVETTIVNGKIIVENRNLTTYSLAQNHSNMTDLAEKVKTLGDHLSVKARGDSF